MHEFEGAWGQAAHLQVVEAYVVYVQDVVMVTFYWTF